MKRIYSFMVAAVASFAAISCTQELENTTPATPEVSGETVVFTAYTDGADDSKTVLSGKQSLWCSGDKIWILNGKKDDTGWKKLYSTLDDQTGFATFTQEDDSYALEGEKFFAVYPSSAADNATWNGEDDVNGVYLKSEQSATAGSYDPSAHIGVAQTDKTTLSFKNAVSLLKFKVANEGVKNVTFYSIGGELISGNCNINANGTVTPWTGEGEAKDYVELSAGEGTFDTTKEYILAVFPQTLEQGFTVQFSFGEAKKDVRSYTKGAVTLERNTILNLGTLTYDPNVVDASVYGVVGTFQDGTTWDVANPVAMEYVSDGWIVAKNVELYKSDEFKFVKDKSWDVSYGGNGGALVADVDKEYTLSQGGQNIKVNNNGKFDLYFKPDTKGFKYSCVEEYTDLKVTITIDNKANWSPLSITLKDGNTVIADNEAVTNNEYKISGDYIGSTLTCTLSNGNKSDERNVVITKNGATITLEETIIKLKIQLNTANSKQWWGNTMKIHAWNTATSFDTSWPGNTMTSEGNYTWSIIVPSELVGKTINYCVHNGNGWQSKDATVIIKAEGNTVTGSSIGIN